MGYYVEIVESTAVIPAAVKAEVYKRWCALNHPSNNHRKQGGSYSSGGKQDHWYSWMSPTYDQECKTTEDILSELGFDYGVNDVGDIAITGYDHKTGQEGLFFHEVEDLLTGSISWCGEDGKRYKWVYKG